MLSRRTHREHHAEGPQAGRADEAVVSKRIPLRYARAVVIVPAQGFVLGMSRVPAGLAWVQRLVAVGLEELEPVVERVSAVEAVMAGELAVPGNRVARLLQPAGECGQPVDEHTGVGLAGRGERLLDAEVHLQVAAAEPAPAARGKHRWLVEFLHAEHIAPEGTALRLAVARDRELHMVDRQQPEAGSVRIEGVVLGHGLGSLLAQDAPMPGGLQVDGMQVAAQQLEAGADGRTVLEQQSRAGGASSRCRCRWSHT